MFSRRRRPNSRSTSSPALWPWMSLTFLKWSMSHSRIETGIAAHVGALHELLELHAHVAAVVQAGELVGDGQLHRLVEARAQRVEIALLAHLRLHAGAELFRVDRLDDDVGRAEVERADSLLLVVRLGDDKDRQVARGLPASGNRRTAAGHRASRSTATRSSGRPSSRKCRAGWPPNARSGGAGLRDSGRCGAPGARSRRPPECARARGAARRPQRRSRRCACREASRLRSSSATILYLVSARTRDRRCRSLTGLVRKSSAPAPSPRRRSSRSFSAVTSTIGMCSVRGSILSRRHASTPFSFGIITSIRMTSGSSASALSMASSPSTAVMTWKYSFFSLSVRSLRFCSMSSTTRTRALISPLSATRGGGVARRRQLRGDVSFFTVSMNGIIWIGLDM